MLPFSKLQIQNPTDTHWDILCDEILLEQVHHSHYLLVQHRTDTVLQGWGIPKHANL